MAFFDAPINTASVNTIPFRLVAHRGHPSLRPENTIDSLQHALRHGAKWVEVDVQLTKDQHPVLFHDVTLARASGDHRSLFDVTWAELQALRASFSERLGVDGPNVPFSDLADLIRLLDDCSDVRAFVELKGESAQHFGLDEFLGCVKTALEGLKTAESLAAIISLDWQICLRARQLLGCPVGWVIPDWSRRTQQDAERLAPEFLFVDHHRVPNGAQLWAGDWNWAAYTIDDLATCTALARMGFEFIETDAIGQLIGASTNH